MRTLLLAAATLTCVTSATLLDEAPTAAAVLKLPFQFVADTLPVLVAEAVWVTVLVLRWVALTVAVCEMAPPATAAISTSVQLNTDSLVSWQRG
jgi:hypothetical protein